jgi:tRNA-dihydrouridine synthase
MKLAFMHVIEGSTGGPRDFAPFDYEALHVLYKQAHSQGVWMLNNGYDRTMALEAVASGLADAVAFGKPFISNPDLVRRLREDALVERLKRDGAEALARGRDRRLDRPRVRAAVLGIVLPLAILYPLTGLSLIAALAIERAATLVRRRLDARAARRPS